MAAKKKRPCLCQWCFPYSNAPESDVYRIVISGTPAGSSYPPFVGTWDLTYFSTAVQAVTCCEFYEYRKLSGSPDFLRFRLTGMHANGTAISGALGVTAETVVPSPHSGNVQFSPSSYDVTDPIGNCGAWTCTSAIGWPSAGCGSLAISVTRL